VCDALDTFYSADGCDDRAHLHWTIDALLSELRQAKVAAVTDTFMENHAGLLRRLADR
jgi:hypothetical protein